MSSNILNSLPNVSRVAHPRAAPWAAVSRGGGVPVCMAVKPAQIGKAGKRVLNDKFFQKAKVNGSALCHDVAIQLLASSVDSRLVSFSLLCCFVA